MVLKLLGDKTRLTMVKILDTQECCVCEFVEVFQVSQPSISQHLRKLRDLNLVKEERFSILSKNNEFYPLLHQILELLPRQVNE